jgi:hypothetical protein
LVDVNGDGKVDLLSGSYSRKEKDMAGLFQVLWGKGKGTFETAAVLEGTDGAPLIIPAVKKHVTDKICTRPTAVDLDGDGHLDIVSGNFIGSFAVFRGLGKGKFEPTPTWLETDGERIKVKAHSDPFFVDWDGDGDLDMLSGSSQGGVYLFTNRGTTTEPEFGKSRELVKARGYAAGTRFGDQHLSGPQSSTRVWVDDVNGDGQLDLLIGDNASINSPADGLDEKTALAKLEVWQGKSRELAQAVQEATDKKVAQKAYSDHWKARDAIIKTERTGFVWLLLQKKTPAGPR